MNHTRRIGREWRVSQDGQQYLALQVQEFGGIYQIVNRQTGSLYIGASVEIVSRYFAHLQALARGGHPNPSLQAEYDRHGPEGYALEIVQLAPAAVQFSLEAEAITQAVLGGAFIHNRCHVSQAARRLLVQRGAPECWPPAGDRYPFDRIQANAHAQSQVTGARMNGEEGQPFPPAQVLKVLRQVYGAGAHPNVPRLYADRPTDLVSTQRRERKWKQREQAAIR